MALYDLPPKDQISTLKTILEIAEGIKKLNDDPEYLNAVIEKAYALTDQEQKKLEIAKSEIGKYEDLVKEQKKNLSVLLEEANKLDEKKVELDDLQSKIDAIRQSLESKERAINNAQLQLSSDQKSLQVEKDKAESDKQNNIQKSLLLDQKEKDILGYETELKNKAEQLKALAGGI